MTVTYRIVDWNKHFENNRSRELKALDWVKVPNKQDGDGYCRLVEHRNGAAHLGVWLAIVQVASKCDLRGTLVRQGRPHTPESLARITRLPERLITEALERLASPEIGWIERLGEGTSAIDAQAAPSAAPAPRRTKPSQKEAAPAAQHDEAEVEWRIEKCWEVFLVQRRAFVEHMDGVTPSSLPTLTDEIRADIRAAVLTHDAALLGSSARNRWLRESKAAAAAVGLFLDPWCSGRHRENDTTAGGRRFLEAWRPWRRQRGKPDPVERFASLYFETKDRQAPRQKPAA